MKRSRLPLSGRSQLTRRHRTIGKTAKPTVGCLVCGRTERHECLPRKGRALQIVTIKPDEFLAWTRARNLPNTAANRLEFVQSKAKRAGSETSGVGASAAPGNVPLPTA